MKRVFILFAVFYISIIVISQDKYKVGMIGLDTSHSPKFVEAINDPRAKPLYQEFKVVVAYPYGSKTIKNSIERIPEYIEEVKKHGVKIVSSIEELLNEVDFVLLETNDGNLHLEQANEVFKAGKVTFIDKPIGANLAQAIAVFELARKYNVPVFSSSVLRFATMNQNLAKGKSGEILGVDCYSPAPTEPTHPDFSWYGIHGVETLFTIMGTGCIEVNRMSGKDNDIVVGLWEDGRIGSFRARQTGRFIYGGNAFTPKGAFPVGKSEGYELLLDEILMFFKSKVVPVSEKETLEIFTFMEASNESKKNNGSIISMEKTFKRGQKEAKKLLKKLK